MNAIKMLRQLRRCVSHQIQAFQNRNKTRAGDALYQKHHPLALQSTNGIQDENHA